MEIKGIENMTNDMLALEINNGGKFIIYKYCISIGIMTFQRSSKVYFFKNNESSFLSGIKYSLFTFLSGWWGIP